MRRLMLLRHAKSDHPPGVADVDRPLNTRGLAAAPRMGAYLAAEGLKPDHVLVSPSRRTQETWEGVRVHLDLGEAETAPLLYEALAQQIHAVIRSAPAGAASLLVVGHNPGLHDLALHLVGSGGGEARRRLRAKFPTAALAVIDFEGDDWNAVGREGGRLERFVIPRDLGAPEV